MYFQPELTCFRVCITEKISTILSGTVSDLIALAIYALLNGGTFSEANRLMITGVAATTAGALVSYAILQTAMLVGTASTGTAYLRYAAI